MREIGTVLFGSVNIENTDLWGNKFILSNVSAGGIFEESYAFCGEQLMVDAVAAEDIRVLKRIFSYRKQKKYEKVSW